MENIFASPDWGRDFRNATTDLGALDRLGLIDADTRAHGREIQENFDVRVPRAFLREILEEDDLALRRQFVPTAEELKVAPGEMVDPIGDEFHSPVPFVTHRYPDRALLKVTYTCGVYCRFCFRRYKVSSGDNPSAADLRHAIAYIAAHPEIREVILTGGDPLVLSDARLKMILDELNQIPHLESLRVHTRMPTAVPSRVSAGLLDVLGRSRLPIWFALHINHPREITAAAEEALARLHAEGIPLLNQSVLLRGVNDDVVVLKDLSRALLRNRVRPYYLHYPDQARGTSHFRVPLSRAVELVSDLRGELSGFAIPQLVVDIPGGHGKVPVGRVWAATGGAAGDSGKVDEAAAGTRTVANEGTGVLAAAEEWSFTSPLDGGVHLVDYSR